MAKQEPTAPQFITAVFQTSNPKAIYASNAHDSLELASKNATEQVRAYPTARFCVIYTAQTIVHANVPVVSEAYQVQVATEPPKQ